MRGDVADSVPDVADSLARFVEGAGSVPSAARDQAEELRAALGDCLADPPPAEQIERLVRWCALVFPARYPDAAARLGDVERLATTAAGV